MPPFVYRKSSYSNPERECVEVAANVPGVVAVRDSKEPGGPVLRFPAGGWAAFSAGIAEGRFSGPGGERPF